MDGDHAFTPAKCSGTGGLKYLAGCSCGWSKSPWGTKAQAERGWGNHVMPTRVEPEMCNERVTFRRHYPGQEPDEVCNDHGDDTVALARSLGVKIPLEPLRPEIAENLRCSCTVGRLQTIHVIPHHTREEQLKILFQNQLAQVSALQDRWAGGEDTDEALLILAARALSALVEWIESPQ